MSTPTAKLLPASRYYRALTGVRAVAAYLIFWHHFNPLRPLGASAPLAFPQALVLYASQGLKQGHIGVPIFFVLSGFLIASRYTSSVAPSWQWAATYARNRFARIYPVYFLVTVLTLVVQFSPGSAYHSPELVQLPAAGKLLCVLLNITLLKGLFARFILASGVGVAWSLSVEVLFYLSAPLVLLAAKRRRTALLVYPASALAIGWLLVGLGTLAPAYLYGFMNSLKFMLNWTFFGRCTEFAWGMALAFYLRRQGLAQRQGAALTISGLLWVAGCVAYLTHAEWNYPRTGFGLHEYASIALNNFILPVGIVLLLAGLVQEKTYLRALLETKLFEVLGKSSYAFYLLHNGLLRALLGTYAINSVLVFGAVLGLSIVLFYLVEEPLHAYLRAPAPAQPLD